ncbi:MAG: S8 family serine peptidase [Rhodomicrobium sp.]
MRLLFAIELCIALMIGFQTGWAQNAKPAGTVFVPESSIRQAQPLISGFEGESKAFTNIAVFVPAIHVQPMLDSESAPPAPYFIETPSSIACVYGLVQKQSGCNPSAVHANARGGSKVIAIVDAFDSPAIKSDLEAFSNRFGLPSANLEVVFASGTRPPNDKGWEIEISLDVEWAHAMAPGAKIILVEANSNAYCDLLAAVDMASELVASQGGGQVSLSWGGSEFATESTYDSHFTKPGVVYFVAAGDTPGVSYPAMSPNVVAVGGTTINRDAKSGALVGETPWKSSGAGPSAFEHRPSYQNGISVIVGNARGVADVAAIADPSKGGIWVYDSQNSSVRSNKGWIAVGGTSAATPIIAGIANNAGRFAGSGSDELTHIYTHAADFTDIKAGTCGPVGVYAAVAGWDYCTGMGTPNGKGGL